MLYVKHTVKFSRKLCVNLISIVIPVYNEEQNIPALSARLFPILDSLKRQYEVIFINDGSKDSSLALLINEYKARPEVVRVIDFNANFGQHTAIMAGFREARGDMVITLDADLQNPPEEIPRVIACIDEGHDVVGTIRMRRKDTFFRKTASKLVNKFMNRITGFALNDYGCMLRGYRRDIVDIINEAGEASTFLPALAQKYAGSPVEIEVSHSERSAGESKYSMFRLIRLYFDLMTAFSNVPLQLITESGMIIFGLGVIPCVMGKFWEGLMCFLAGYTVACVGVVGEYIGRMYQEVRKRPRYIIRKIYEGGKIDE